MPPSTFALPGDGRQQKHLCDLRKHLAVTMATYADPDGSQIRCKAETLANKMGRDRATVFRLLKDLKELGFETKGKLAWWRGPRYRTLNVAKMRAVEVASSQSSKSHLRAVGVASSQSSESHLHDVGVASSRQTQPPLDRPLEPPVEKGEPSVIHPRAREAEALPPSPALVCKVLEKAVMPVLPQNLATVGAAIAAIQKRFDWPYLVCCDWLVERINTVLKSGVPVNRFWFEDGKYAQAQTDDERFELKHRALRETLRSSLETGGQRDKRPATAVCSLHPDSGLTNWGTCWECYSEKHAGPRPVRVSPDPHCADCGGSGMKLVQMPGEPDKRASRCACRPKEGTLAG